MKKWVPAYWQQQSLLRRLRDSLHWGMEESVKILAQELLSFFFFLQMKTTKDENPLQHEKERIKAF